MITCKRGSTAERLNPGEHDGLAEVAGASARLAPATGACKRSEFSRLHPFLACFSYAVGPLSDLVTRGNCKDPKQQHRGARVAWPLQGSLTMAHTS